MDPCFSGEDLVIKARKPYTITKQRERWTDEEHTRFLEALKLYGRAWQRIEEHIGTKTAIQIRSHAQKFFTKLEKEANAKGVGSGLDIAIPPPRPKRKPTNPYPRKASEAPVLQLELKDSKISDANSTSLSTAFVKGPDELADDAKRQNSDGFCEKDDSVEASNLDMVAPCTSPTSENSSLASESPKSEKSCTFRQFVPLNCGSNSQNESVDFLFTAKPMENHAEEKDLLNENAPNSMVTTDLCISLRESVDGEMVRDCNEKTSQNCPRHVAVHILDGSFGTTQNLPEMPFVQLLPNQTGGVSGVQTPTNPTAPATSENYVNGQRPAIQPPFFHPFAPIPNPDNYQSLMQMSSTFSNLILSALTQNAAMYAAASFASTMWPWFNMGAPHETIGNSSGIPQSMSMNPNSNMAAIAGATVAAATAWWAANGLLPLCPQYHPGYAYSPASAPAAQMAGSQSANVNGIARENGADLRNTRNSPTPSSSESEASEAEKGSNPIEIVEAEKSDDSNKSKSTKQMDRSSSGSNTLSSSEMEPDAMEMDAKVNDEEQLQVEPDTVLPTFDLSSRHSRSSTSLNDSWREVSEEGRLAFQALFSREVLPQSFSSKNKVNKHCSKPGEDEELTTFKLYEKQDVDNSSSFNIVKTCDSLLTDGIQQAKLKVYRTGFRLYKRCSMEAKEIPEEHRDPKKLRL